jgi:hypothetical protein
MLSHLKCQKAPSTAKPVAPINAQNQSSGMRSTIQTQNRRKRSGKSGMGGLHESDEEEGAEVHILFRLQRKHTNFIQYGGNDRAQSTSGLHTQGRRTTHQPQLGQRNNGQVGAVLASNRSEEFENFKHGKGAEMTKILSENKCKMLDSLRVKG